MIFVMVPILPAEAAGLEDTERVEILELVESYMDSRETAVMTGDTESLRTVAVNGIVNDENAHRITLSENNVSVSDMSFQISGIDIEDTITFVTLYESMEYVDDGVVKTADIEHNLTIMYDEAYDVAKVVSDSYRETVSGFQSCSYVSEEIQAVSEALYSLNSINTDYCAEIVRVAESQVGYKEKASNSDLDSFTANAGSANYTKYGDRFKFCVNVKN